MSEQSNDRFPASITVTKLYERTSAKGNQYMIGRMGGVKIAVLKTPETDDEGHAIWAVKFSPAPSKASASQVAAAPLSQPSTSCASRGFGRDADDVIPF